jgi:hypothetical protein
MENTNLEETVVENARPLIFTGFNEYVKFNEAKDTAKDAAEDDEDDKEKKKKKKEAEKKKKAAEWKSKKVANKDKKVSDDSNKEISKEAGSLANKLHNQLLKDSKIAKMSVEEIKNKFNDILDSKDLSASKGTISKWKNTIAKAKNITRLQAAVYNIWLKADGLGVNESLDLDALDSSILEMLND